MAAHLTLPSKHMRMGLSADEIDAEEKISGGNLSASSNNVAVASVAIELTVHTDKVMAKIYEESSNI